MPVEVYTVNSHAMSLKNRHHGSERGLGARRSREENRLLICLATGAARAFAGTVVQVVALLRHA